MKYELRENQGISAPLLALMAVATGLSVANCYYNQPLLGSMAKDFAVSDFSGLCGRACICHSAWRPGFTKETDIDQLHRFFVRLVCHSTRPEHLLGVGRILACRGIFGHAAVLYSVGVV